MSKLKLLLFLAVGSFIFQACNKDDEGSFASEADLIGLWTSSEITAEFIVDGASYENESLASTIENDEEKVEFRADKTYTANEGTSEEENGTWSLSSNGSIITFDPDGDESYNFEVVSASSSQLKVKYEEDFTAFAQFFGVAVENEFLIVATITLTK